MAIHTIISDGNSKANRLKILDEGELGVVLHTHPPEKESRISLPFRQYFTDDGTSSGSNDMRVDGSVTPVEFYIGAEEGFEVFIKFISIKIADAGAKLDKFGALAALTNGVEFEWQSQKLGSLTIHDGLKDNLEFFRLSNLSPGIVDLSGGGADAAIVSWDLSNIFGNPWGLRISENSLERIIFRVRDDLSTGLDEFNIIGHGSKLK